MTLYGEYAEHFEGSCSSSTCTTPASPNHPPETSTPCSCRSQCQCSEEEDGEQHSWTGDNLDDIAKLKRKGSNDTSPSSLERPFICKKCMTTFKRKYDLVQHTSAVHDKKRPYTCSKCASRFAHKGTLTKHVSFLTSSTTSTQSYESRFSSMAESLIILTLAQTSTCSSHLFSPIYTVSHGASRSKTVFLLPMFNKIFRKRQFGKFTIPRLNAQYLSRPSKNITLTYLCLLFLLLSRFLL